MDDREGPKNRRSVEGGFREVVGVEGEGFYELAAKLCAGRGRREGGGAIRNMRRESFCVHASSLVHMMCARLSKCLAGPCEIIGARRPPGHEKINRGTTMSEAFWLTDAIIFPPLPSF